MGNFSSSTCTVTIPLPLLREPHITTFSTSSQRTEAGSGGISWAFPLVEGGETLPSSCSPLLATLDIATWLEQGLPLQTSTFTLLSARLAPRIHSRDLFCAGSKVTRCAREEWELKSTRVHLAGRKSAVTPLYYGRFRIFNAQRASLLA